MDPHLYIFTSPLGSPNHHMAAPQDSFILQKRNGQASLTEDQVLVFGIFLRSNC